VNEDGKVITVVMNRAIRAAYNLCVGSKSAAVIIPHAIQTLVY
jgi:hypothetical protein